eukprot:10672875-Alexandrium_andersonii.AAC.1
MQSALRPMLISAAIRLNPQSAMRNMQNRFTRSNLELRGPKSGLKIGPRSSRGVRSAPFLAQISNLLTKAGLEGV